MPLIYLLNYYLHLAIIILTLLFYSLAGIVIHSLIFLTLPRSILYQYFILSLFFIETIIAVLVGLALLFLDNYLLDIVVVRLVKYMQLIVSILYNFYQSMEPQTLLYIYLLLLIIQRNHLFFFMYHLAMILLHLYLVVIFDYFMEHLNYLLISFLFLASIVYSIMMWDLGL